MIQRDYIIEQALLTVGDVTGYNDTASYFYSQANSKLNAVIRETCTCGLFYFNATSIKLTSSLIDENTGMYRFNKPQDFCGFRTEPRKETKQTDRARSVWDDYADTRHQVTRIEGDFIYSNQQEIIFSYNRMVELQNFPEYMERYLYLSLAKELCTMHEMFARKLDYIIRELNTEKIQRQINDGAPNRMVMSNATR